MQPKAGRCGAEPYAQPPSGPPYDGDALRPEIDLVAGALDGPDEAEGVRTGLDAGDAHPQVVAVGEDDRGPRRPIVLDLSGGPAFDRVAREGVAARVGEALIRLSNTFTAALPLAMTLSSTFVMTVVERTVAVPPSTSRPYRAPFERTAFSIRSVPPLIQTLAPVGSVPKPRTVRLRTMRNVSCVPSSAGDGSPLMS